MIQKPQTAAEVTPDMITEWKSKYKVVKKVEIPVDDNDSEVATFFIRKPSVMEMDAVTKVATSQKSGGQAAAAKLMRKTLVLGGDMKYLDPSWPDAEVMIVLGEEIGELVSQKKAISTEL